MLSLDLTPKGPPLFYGNLVGWPDDLLTTVSRDVLRWLLLGSWSKRRGIHWTQLMLDEFWFLLKSLECVSIVDQDKPTQTIRSKKKTFHTHNHIQPYLLSISHPIIPYPLCPINHPIIPISTPPCRTFQALKPDCSCSKLQTIDKHGSLPSYCWWLKSCTTKDDDYPIIYRVLTIPGGAGFQPSTVPSTALVS